MKKLVSLLLVALFLVSFASCKNSENKGEKTKTTTSTTEKATYSNQSFDIEKLHIIFSTYGVGGNQVVLVYFENNKLKIYQNNKYKGPYDTSVNAANSKLVKTIELKPKKIEKIKDYIVDTLNNYDASKEGTIQDGGALFLVYNDNVVLVDMISKYFDKTCDLLNIDKELKFVYG